jgi:outer membrane protein TolC
MGLISLSGIVVRNAIILVDYIKEKMSAGLSIEQAATEAGERRLRPIFLTTMAAAVGVTPMILSGSSLWSPLASTIAFGLIFSMFFTLLVVPVFYVLVRRRTKVPAAPVLALLCLIPLMATPARAETRRLTLPEAIDLALEHNPGVKIARARIKEAQQKTLTARADYFPHLASDANLLHSAETELVTIPAGAFGAFPILGAFPPQRVTFSQGSEFLFLTNTTLSQPLTQIFKIREGVRIAESDRRISEDEERKVEDEVAFGVRQVYFGILAAQEQKKAAGAEIAAGAEALREAQEALQAGNALEATVLAARTSLLQSRQSLMAAEDQVSDLTAELNALLGLPADTELQLDGISMSADPPPAREQMLEKALRRSPEIQAAKETIAKANSAVAAAKNEYIPDIGAFARYTYQNGVPFLTHNNGIFGLQMTWNLFDWGKRRGIVAQRQAQLEQAQENLRRIQDRISVDIGKACRKLERAQQMLSVVREALELRKESERLAGNQLKAEVISQAKYEAAIAATRKAEADELQARLACELARAEILRLAGL